MKYKIVNRVASSFLGAQLDLFNLAVSHPDIEYEPEQFPGAIMRMNEPKVTLLLFKNGKIICAGAGSDEEVPLAIKRCSEIIHKYQPDIKVLKNPVYKIVNIVANAQIDKTFNLFDMALKLDNVEYEPEQFPGAIIRLYKPKVSLLLFKNGKVICAGAKSEKEVVNSIKEIEKLTADKK